MRACLLLACSMIYDCFWRPALPFERARACSAKQLYTDSGSDEMGAGSITMMFSDSYVKLNGSIMSAHIGGE